MSNPERILRVVLAKPGLDGHDRGAKMLALALRDAGMEVTYLGIRSTAEEIVKAAVEEDADVVALSCLSGAHSYHFPRVAGLLAEGGLENVLLIGGGVIPPEDVPALEQQGFRAIFGPGASITEIIDFIRAHVREQSV